MRRIVTLLCLVAAVRAETIDDAVRVLARRIQARLVPGERLSLQARALAPVPAGERERVERGLRGALARNAVPVGAQAQLRVTVSAALAHRVLVAEFSRAGEFTVLMSEYDAVETAPRPVRSQPVLERSLIWEQEEQILDAAIVSGNGDFWVLDTGRATLRNRNGEAIREVRLRRTTEPWPRDVRGRVAIVDGEPQAWVPGGTPGAWPAARGFDALPAGENEFAAGGLRFFTAARITDSAVLLAGVDGKLRWSEAGAVRELDGLWGTEIAAVTNPCGGGAPVVLASSRDGLSLGVHEARTLRQAGEGMTLPGTLSALWPGEGDTSATAVVRTAAGRYAAYRVFASCSR